MSTIRADINLEVKVKIKIFLIMLVFVFCFLSLSWGATYYISPSGDNSNVGDDSHPWLTLQYAVGQMSGGDTLIVKDGIYRGDVNSITWSIFPPTGNAVGYTTIKAEHDGEAIFDGENARFLFYHTNDVLTSRYWQFEGLVWCRTTQSNIILQNASYVKFIRCGVYDVPDGNHSNIAMTDCQYCLLEGCYSYGSGRYKFSNRHSQYIIFRNCVARSDRINAGGEPAGGFIAYGSDDVLMQNCIYIDSDRGDSYSNIGVYMGGFGVPSTDRNANRISVVNGIVLNSQMGGFHTTGNEYYAASDVTLQDCIFWDYTVPSSYLNTIRGIRTTVNNCTFGEGNVATRIFSSSDHTGGHNDTVMKNNIVYNQTGTSLLFYDVETEDYNCLYGNTGSGLGLHDLLSNPIWNASTNPTGALKYIVRTESGNNLAGLGESGTQIGANVKALIGISGTLWGESGYNTDTEISMWPFPNEDLIRTKMAAYTYDDGSGGDPEVTGARGFCADGETLTHYIMDYLGNGDPYSALFITTSSLAGGTVGSAYSASVSAVGGTEPYSFEVTSGSLPTGLEMSSAGAITGTPTVADTYNFTVTVTDAEEATDDQALSITVSEEGEETGDGVSILTGRFLITGRAQF